MKYSVHLLVLSLTFLVSACLPDMEAPRNAPDAPTIKSSDLTRVAVTLTGTYPRGADVTEYGFQWSQDGFETYKTEQNPRMTDEGTFTWTPTFLTPSTSYLFRSYISNGISTRYSTNLSVKTEATSRATLKDITIRDGYVSASIVDSGGREIVDIGFLCAETDDMAVLKRSKRHWVEMGTGDTFSKSLSSFDPPLEPGKTYYFIAYAEDETDAFGYSPNPQRYDVSVDDMVRFEDDNFGEYVIRHYDTNRDGYISYGEIEGIPLIDVITDNITSVREIRLMPHLRYLSCAGSAIGAGLLTRLDVSGNPELTSLVCDYNKLDSLTVSATPKLDTLSCAGNHLSELLVNDLQSLTWLSCSDNDLDQVDVSYNASLRYLDVSGGRLSMLAIADKTELEELLCRNNHFASLDISHNARLKKLDCAGNMLPALNISDNRSLAYLDCRDNPADTLYLFANQKVETLLKPDAMQLFYLIEGLSLDPEVLTIQVDETATLKPVIVPEDAIDKTVAWACSNDNVATVSDKGIVTGLSVDTCTILATCGGKTAFCHVTVNPVPVASIELDQNAPEILLDETLILHATVLPANATDKTVTWSSSDETVATVSETGVVTAVATGTCEITASSGGKTATAHLTVSPIPVAEVLLNHSVNDITVKESFQLEATVLPENATDKTVTWSSSNEAVATVSDGYVSGVSVGECIITAQAGRKSASCKVTVNPIPVSEIILSETSIELLIGGSQNLTATVLPDDASDKSIVWESSDSRIAKVSNDGVVTAVGVGSCSIHAKSGEVTATCSVTSKAIHVTSIEIIPTECELVVGDSQELTATVLPGNATYKTVYWESSDEEIATVSQNGVVTAMGEGYCRILASADGLSAQCEVAVSPLIIEVTSVTLDATSLAMTTGDTYTLTATVVPSDATDPTVSWTSSDKSVATVSGGTVRAVGAGTCNITAKAGAKSATCHVTVADAVVAVTSVTLNESTLTLTEGNTATLSATVLPDNATDKTVTWTSDDTNVASVSSSGLVTALAAGSCTINARAGTQSATCKLTVKTEVVPVSSISVSPAICTLEIGASQTLVATILPANSTSKTVSWVSDDPSIATVSATGVVTAVAAGNCMITASCGGKKGACAVTVKTGSEESIATITPMELNFVSAGRLIADEHDVEIAVLGSWRLHDNLPTWLSFVNKKTGKFVQNGIWYDGSATLGVISMENPDMSNRSASIVFDFQSEGGANFAQKTLTINQAGDAYYIGVINPGSVNNEFSSSPAITGWNRGDDDFLVLEFGASVDMKVTIITNDATATFGIWNGWSSELLRIPFGDAPPLNPIDPVTGPCVLHLTSDVNMSDEAKLSRSFPGFFVNGQADSGYHDAYTRLVIYDHNTGKFTPSEMGLGESRVKFSLLPGATGIASVIASPERIEPINRGGEYDYSITTYPEKYGIKSQIQTIAVKANRFWRVVEVDNDDNRLVKSQNNYLNPSFSRLELNGVSIGPYPQKTAGGVSGEVYLWLRGNTTGETRTICLAFYTGSIEGNRIVGGAISVVTFVQVDYYWWINTSVINFPANGQSGDNRTFELEIFQAPYLGDQNLLFETSLDWISVQQKGNYDYIVTAEINESSVARSGYLYVKNNYANETRAIMIEQSGQSWSAPSMIDIPSNGTGSSSRAYIQLSVDGKFPDYYQFTWANDVSWLHLYPIEPTTSTGASYYVEANNTGAIRVATVVLKNLADNTERQITFTQEPSN
jgi:uncharacterized protein YjdB